MKNWINLRLLYENTKNIYERNADQFHKNRDKSLFEKYWLDKFIDQLPENANVLDIGCASGDPISKYLILNKINVEGIDISVNLIEKAKKNFPNNHWHLGDMRNLKLYKQFNGLIAWNSFFHLNQADQVLVLEKFQEHLLDDGVLMFTAGSEWGEVIGRVGNEDVYHSSFSYDEYKAELEKRNFMILEHKLNDPSCRGHSVYLARKVR